MGGLEPWGYHLINVAMHGAVTGLFTSLARLLLGGGLWSLLAGLLFASHPIHTEAVAGVVGRADEGAALFFLLSLLCYIRHCKLRGHAGPCWQVAWFLGSLACAACSMLWKELGVTVLAISALYDVCVFHRLKLRQVIMLLYKVNSLFLPCCACERWSECRKSSDFRSIIRKNLANTNGKLILVCACECYMCMCFVCFSSQYNLKNICQCMHSCIIQEIGRAHV